jgi:hypothetical protein
LGGILDERTWDRLPPIGAAFLDPDWAITSPGHVHRFPNSTTLPPADHLLQRVLRATRNVALVRPPQLDLRELDTLPLHERQEPFLDGSHELGCLRFGELAVSAGGTESRTA